MRYYLFFIFIIFSFCACQNDLPKEKSSQKNEASAQLLENYSKERLAYFPMEATYAGEDDYNDKFVVDISEENRSSLRAFYQKINTALKDFDNSKLNAEELISHEILVWECENY